MNGKLKQCILEMLRMGEDPDVLQHALAVAYEDVGKARHYKGENQVAEFAQALKDANYRP